MIDLIDRLRQAGSTGLDLSPGDPLCAEAAEEIERLRKRQHMSDLNYDALEKQLKKAEGQVAFWKKQYNEEREQGVELGEKYSELIMQVSNKYPHESRHETALRYLREREAASRVGEAKSAKEG